MSSELSQRAWVLSKSARYWDATLNALHEVMGKEDRHKDFWDRVCKLRARYLADLEA